MPDDTENLSGCMYSQQQRSAKGHITNSDRDPQETLSACQQTDKNKPIAISRDAHISTYELVDSDSDTDDAAQGRGLHSATAPVSGGMRSDKISVDLLDIDTSSFADTLEYSNAHTTIQVRERVGLRPRSWKIFVFAVSNVLRQHDRRQCACQLCSYGNISKSMRPVLQSDIKACIAHLSLKDLHVMSLWK